MKSQPTLLFYQNFICFSIKVHKSTKPVLDNHNMFIVSELNRLFTSH